MTEEKKEDDIPKPPVGFTDEEMEIRVDPGQQAMRIDRFLMDKLFRASRTRIQKAIEDGVIVVDGKRVKSNFRLKKNMLITIKWSRVTKTHEWVRPENIPLDIRYEDDDVLVIHKPAGMVVHPGVGIKYGTLVNALAYYFKDLELPIAKGNTPDRPGLVHRIDKETTGLMVVAKTEAALTHLSKQFFDHSIERKYVALVWGEPEGESGTIDLPIGRDPRNRIKRKAFKDPSEGEGKHAITHWKMLERMYYVSLMEMELETGRTHQIRVHFASQGHPLFNDKTYGGDRIRKGTVYTKFKQFVENGFKLMPRQALHAKILGFTHPTTGERMRFEAELPDDFQAVLNKWRNYVAGRSNI